MNAQYQVELYDPATDTRGFIVIDSLLGGLATGGLRMSPTVTMQEIQGLAEVMTYKHSVMNLPLGGAKAGLVGDPTAPDKHVKLAAFARMAEPFLRTCYVVGEDMGLEARDVGFMYRSIRFDPIALIQKRLQERGAHLQVEGTFSVLAQADFMDQLAGYGLMESIEEASTILNYDLQQLKVAVQGFGTVGSGVAKLLAHKGVHVVAVSDIEGTLYSESGLDVELLDTLRKPNGCIDRTRVEQAVLLERDELLSLSVDVLVPAALGGVIHAGNADKIQATLVVEGANMPTTPEADAILARRGIKVLPDFVVNSGAATTFALLFTGQSGMDDVRAECSRRLRDTVRTLLTADLQAGETHRTLAKRMATEKFERFVADEREE